LLQDRDSDSDFDPDNEKKKVTLQEWDDEENIIGENEEIDEIQDEEGEEELE